MDRAVPQWRRDLSTAKYDPEVYVSLAEQGLSNVAIAERLGVDEASVRRGLRKAGYKRHLIPVNHLANRFTSLLDEPFHVYVTEDPVMVTADWHIPLYDPHFVNHMIERAREIGSKTLVIAGDFWNADALSRFEPKQVDAGLDREWEEGKAVMRVLCETFDEIYYTYGNHDARFVKALGFQILFASLATHLFAGIPRISEVLRVSNLDHLWVHAGGKSYYVCHPKAYSKKPLTTAIEIASKVNANVLTAHAHHCAVGYAKNGVHIVSDVGGMFDATRIAYIRDSTTYPNWSQGFGWIDRNGAYYLESPGFSFRSLLEDN